MCQLDSIALIARTSLDLSKLMGGRNFTKKCKVSFNNYATSLNALIDTGADVYVAINRAVAKNFRRKTDAPRQDLSRTVPIKGYDDTSSQKVRRVTWAHLTIDGRKDKWVPCLEVNMGPQLIIGRLWLDKHDVDVSCRHRSLRWSPTSLSHPVRDRDIPFSLDKAKQRINPVHQADADRRDRLLEKDEQRRRAGAEQRPIRYSTPTRTDPQEENLRKMRDALEGLPPRPSKSPKTRTATQPALEVNFIGASLWDKAEAADPSEFQGVCSLNLLGALISERADEDPETARLINERLPERYSDFKDVFSEKASNELAPHRACDHKIVLEAENNLRHSPLYHMPLQHLERLREHLKNHMALGFIEPSDAAYGSPVLFAKKPGGGWRFCIDYRKLNAITKKDAYPPPLIGETIRRIGKAKVFTKLDIRQAFHRIRIHPDSEDLTTFKTRYGNYRMKVLPFGLTNGPATFQRYLNEVLFDILDVYVTAYMDDILIFSEDPKSHDEHVKEVLRRLRKAGLQADIKKSEFSVMETRFLGQIVSTKGLRTDPEKVRTILEWEAPKRKKALRSFLGLANYYRQFISGYSRIARPLTRLTSVKEPWSWGSNEQAAFEALKQAVASAPALVHYDPEAETRVETDASGEVVAGVMHQKDKKGKWHPVAFYSHAMTSAEANYGIPDKEMLAVITALKEWHPELILLQKPFTVVTDQQALRYFSEKKTLSERQVRWSETISQYHFTFEWRPGKDNIVADALSRKQEDLITLKAKRESERWLTLIPESHRPALTREPEALETRENNLKAQPGDPVDAAILKRPSVNTLEAEEDDLMEVLREANRATREDPRQAAAWELAAQSDEGPWRVEDGLLTWEGRLLVPDTGEWRAKLLKLVHNTPVTAHPGKNKTRKLVRQRFYWKGMSSDVDRYVANCKTCRRTSTPRDKTPGMLHPLPVPDRPWQHISMDFKTFPKDDDGRDNALVVVDRLGKRAYTIPCTKSVTAEETAWLYYDRIWRIYGTPETVVSDRGPQFVSAFAKELCNLTGVKQKLSTAHHPQTDGNTERYIQALDQRLRAFVNHYQTDWSRWLPSMDFAQATVPHESTGLTPFEVEFGYPARMVFDWRRRDESKGPPREKLATEAAQQFAKRAHQAWETAKEDLRKAQERQKQQADKKRREPDFEPGDLVYVSRKGWVTDRPSVKLDHQRAGPYKVLEKVGHSFRLQLPDYMHVHDVFSADKLRRAANNPLPGQEDEQEPAIQVDGEDEWEVEEIIASRVSYGRLQYKVHWKGWDLDPQYYNAEGFKGAPHKIRQFHKAHPDAAGPPSRLPEWLTAWENDEPTPPAHEKDNHPVKGAKRGRKRVL